MERWMRGNEIEDAADRIVDQAIQGNCFFCGPSRKLKEAINLYLMAVEEFKTAGDGNNAATIYVKMAECYLKLGRKYKGMEAYIAAADCLKGAKDETVLVSYLLQAIHIAYGIGQHSRAADICRGYADYFESLGKLEQAIECNEEAYHVYQIDGPLVFAQQCKLKIALQAAIIENYQKAKEIFEEMAQKSLNATLEKHKFQGNLLNAGICALCEGNIDAMTHALKEYQELDQSFSTTREFRFLSNAITYFDKADVAMFTSAVNEYERLASLDLWKRTLLSRVGEKLEWKAREMELEWKAREMELEQKAREMELELRARETEEIDYITGA